MRRLFDTSLVEETISSEGKGFAGRVACRGCALLKLGLWACLLAGCAKTDLPTDTGAPAEVSQRESLPAPEEVSTEYDPDFATKLTPDEAYPLAEMTPDALLKYIGQLATQPPRGQTQTDFLADQVSRAKSQLIAAERIIRSDGDASLVEAATKAKLDTLRILAVLENAALGQFYQPFVDSLLTESADRYALLARVSLLEYEMDRLGLGQETSPQKLIDRLDAVLSSPGIGRTEFMITQYAGIALDQAGFTDQATSALSRVGKHFAQDPSLRDEAEELLAHTSFRESMLRAASGGQAEFDQLLADVSGLLSGPRGKTIDTLDLTLSAAQMLEYEGRLAQSQTILKKVQLAFADAESALAEQAARALQNADRRMRVVGQEVSIEGVHTDGTPFEWQKLAGKVVLVDFWTTWSGPWYAGLPQLQATYEDLHQDGFEVVGVNLDETMSPVHEFLRETRLPWATVVDQTRGGFGNPNAVRYGVDAVPFVMLVGRDGKVAGIHLRGEQLVAQVRQLLQEPVRTARADTNNK